VSLVASAKPPRPPSFDDKTFSQRLYERVRTATGGQYAVFRPTSDSGDKIGFPRFTEWLRGLRDVVNANALFLDDVKSDFDQFRGATLQKQTQQDNRLAALEAQASDPFRDAG
jgi:hypothetical protein